MLKRSIILFSLILLGTALRANPLSSDSSPPVALILVDQVIVDYKTYYHYKGLPYLFTGLGISAVLANSEFDLIARDEWQSRLRGETTDDFYNAVDDFSELSQYKIFIPLYFLSMWLGEAYPDREGTVFIGQWGNHSLRALLLGAPQQAVFTALLGSSRPEKYHPKWAPFDYARAVSGHAFYGALPLLNLAKTIENPYLKATAYVTSTLPAFARINNDKHYLSQAFLGWWLAFSATQIVWEADEVRKKSHSFIWYPCVTSNSFTFNASLHF